jgi:hypothetical protein
VQYRLGPIANFEAVNRHIQDLLLQFTIRKKPISSKSYFLLTSKSSRYLPPRLKAQHLIVHYTCHLLCTPKLLYLPWQHDCHTSRDHFSYHQVYNCRHSPIADRRRGGHTQGSPRSGFRIARRTYNLPRSSIPIYREAQNNYTNPPQHWRSPLLQRPPDPGCLLPGRPRSMLSTGFFSIYSPATSA